LLDQGATVPERIAFNIAVVADGRGVLSQTAGPATGDLGVKRHFTNVHGDESAITLLALPGCYGGLAPIGNGVWNLSCSVPAALLKTFNGDRDALLDFWCNRTPTLGTMMKSAKPAGEWHASPLPRFGVANTWPPNIWPVGNAAAALEPIGGEGMGLALRSAELVATAIHADRAPATVRQQLHKLWQRRRLACRSAAWALSHLPPASLTAAALPGVGPSLLRLIGKAA
jgi:2-polyprenyl-6-methoxyphenol hydroxylase-like FAD-dependent oxidoreductase